MSNLSPRSVTPLTLEPGPSRLVRLITFGGFILALFCVAVVPLSLAVMTLGTLLLISAFVYTWHGHHALNGEPVSVRLDTTGTWYWQQGEHSEVVELLGDSYHAPFLVILNFRGQGRRRPSRTLLLTTDNIDSESFRRLRIHLKWREGRGGSAA